MNETNEQYPSSHGAVGGGSSTGAPGIPTGLRDQRSHYDTTKGVNPATGASYSKSSAGGPTQNHQQPLSPSPARSDDRIVGDEPLPHTASTAQRAEIQDHSRGSRAGDGIGKGIVGAAASVHGAGESLRGALNTAVDRAFGSHEGAERNQHIADQGAEEIRTGRFSHSK
ncbi:unnamed protein product [Penicillium olsonii]|uniref:Uncharacterized protein n=1 Tax=Penicillium olsonii TaxID=99116 RepID=A0A9W4HU44_PENOL|nr:unnamed protein product [Penicillium olsonii]CAG8121532.1 unnamed protein product [Penicillium olsonii]CAG8161106.1 unnamed protein product [Penicillium olsonii]